ncbi:hypothetical protein [Haloplanus halophilus]|uniref:hypothetical protein n=1 Tax=Haloplanus halophilus TaxID=2949993 RepID=UPI0020403E77|nr:hypothetical protein [Haloplanus sp. GDY1]
MDRRELLALTPALLVTAAGCSIDSESAPSTSSPASTTPDGTSSTDTPTPSGSPARSDPIAIVVSNGRESAVDAALLVTHEADRIFDRTVVVEPGARRSVDPGIDGTGAYELTVSLADDERVRPFDVEDYDLRMGSDLIVEIGERIRVLMEE